MAAQKLLKKSNVPSDEIDILIYSGVCREGFEPATATFVASALELDESSLIYDISNACLGVVNGIIDVANRIELGHSRAGLIVSCESAREINDLTIKSLLDKPTMENFIISLATLTGGSGAIAVLLTDGSFGSQRRKLLGGSATAAPEFCQLCRWGISRESDDRFRQTMSTNSVAVLENGVELGKKNWQKFLKQVGWNTSDVDRTICHQVGSSHRKTILQSISMPLEKDFVSYSFLGNIGTVSLPITAAIAEERQFLNAGDKVAFLGIGSGLNCLMLGWEW